MERDEALEILGLADNYTPEQLREAYLEMVRVHHPDLTAESKGYTMTQINRARSTLAKQAGPEYGIAGEEVWSDVRNWREIAQAAEVDAPPPPKTPSVGLIGRLTRRNRSRTW